MMRRAAVAALGWAVLAAASAAQACVPPAQPRPTAEEIAPEAAKPSFAPKVRDARDIFLARVEQVGPAPLSTFPAGYLSEDGTYWMPEGQPVRYLFTVLEVLKGTSPPKKFEFSTRAPDSWPVAMPEDEGSADTLFGDEDDPAWWSHAYMPVGYWMGGGDCSNQIAFPSGLTYLVFRDGQGEITAARPARFDGPLVRAVEAVLADPTLDYPHRMSVTDYLKASRGLAVVRIEGCAEPKVRVLERVKQTQGAPEAYTTVGESYLLWTPPLGGCARGRRFLAAGGDDLHPIKDGAVSFDDRFLQMRFEGPKTMPLAQVRTLAAER